MPGKNHHRSTPGQRAELREPRRQDSPTRQLVEQLASRHGVEASALLPILQDAALQRGALNRLCLAAVAERIGAQEAHVAGVASFYSMLPDFTASEDSVDGTAMRICDGPVCSLYNSADLLSQAEALYQDDARYCVGRTSCLGLCDRAPAALIGLEPCGPLRAGRLASIEQGWRGEPADSRHAVASDRPVAGELRVTLARIGKLAPDSFEEAVAAGAYEAVRRALAGPPTEVVDVIEQAGLRGCGGAGYPTGSKWRLVAEQPSPTKFVICNADESEPGAFKDRVLLEGDPHLLLEGMLLAAYAVGAQHGVIYVRGEYEEAAQRLELAVAQARAAGWLGPTIAGSDFSFDIQLHRGAGAYICGEETALLDSLEGRRGEPRVRPPYPTTCGYLGQPTVVNNVETLCQTPAIVERGAAWYRSLGPDGAPGTKIFTVTGHVERPGIYESPLRVTVGDVLERFGGGMRRGSRFKMALTGGAAGTLIPAQLLDVPLDYDSHQAGVALGSGVVMVVDDSASAVAVLERVLHFFRMETCGKCTPCRVGAPAAHAIVARIAAGEGQPGDLAELQRMADMLEATSLCGLGQSIAMPIRSAIQHFRCDFEQGGAT